MFKQIKDVLGLGEIDVLLCSVNFNTKVVVQVSHALEEKCVTELNQKFINQSVVGTCHKNIINIDGD